MVVCQLSQLGGEPGAMCQAERSEQSPPAIGLRPKEVTLFIHVCTRLQQHGDCLTRTLSQHQAEVEAVLQLLTLEALRSCFREEPYQYPILASEKAKTVKLDAREPGVRRSMASMDFTDPMQQPA